MSGRKHVKELILHCWYGAQKSANSQFLVKKPEKGGTKARSLVVRREGRAGFRNNYEDDDDDDGDDDDDDYDDDDTLLELMLV